MEAEYERLTNLLLIANGLDHIEYELGDEYASLFRVAREAQFVLYCSMIEALRGTANFNVVRQGDKGVEVMYFNKGNGWLKVTKPTGQPKGKPWRFLPPIPATPPVPTAGATTVATKKKPKEDFLIPFYEALAMVQSVAFMSNYTDSKPLTVTDDEMKILGWLHDNVRNEFEHFVPKMLAAPKRDLLEGADTALRLAKALLYESGCVVLAGEGVDSIVWSFPVVLKKIQERLASA